MKREQFEHTVRAAGAILGVNEVLVIGSQAIHASLDAEFPEAQRSIEADISALEDPDGTSADLIDGSIGELSVFQNTFGYYAQGVTPTTAILPSGWRKRLVSFSTEGTNGVTALCLEPHDLWLSKAAAGRAKDIEFCRALSERDIVKPAVLKRRLKTMNELDSAAVEKVMRQIEQSLTTGS